MLNRIDEKIHQKAPLYVYVVWVRTSLVGSILLLA